MVDRFWRPCPHGLEDNVYLNRETLVSSNAALVGRTVELCEQEGRPVATPAEARDLLGLASMAHHGP